MLNCAVIMGRLTADPELKTTQSGISVTSFSVAVDRNYQKPGAEKQTDFINVQAWRGTAEFVSRYFHKGSMIAVQGSIQVRPYEDRNGNKRTAVEIVADNVSFCGSKAETGTGNGQPAANPYAAPVQPAPTYPAPVQAQPAPPYQAPVQQTPPPYQMPMQEPSFPTDGAVPFGFGGSDSELPF